MTNKTKLFSAVLAMVTLATLGLSAFVFTGPVAAAAPDGRGGPFGQGGNGSGNGNGNGTGTPANPGGTPLTPLDAAEQSALQEAILEEYGALNLYSAVIAQLGSQAPFSQIVQSEQQHVNALTTQAEKYGLAVPTNPGLSTTPTFSTLVEACQAGVTAEIADAALYDELKPVTTHSDLLQVFERLQNASLNNHLPAFQACD